MQIYLPIAELPVNILLILALGGIGGILAGMFGIGGGFLITPILIFMGIPPAIAVATATSQIIASSVSGFMAQWHKRNVDIKMGTFLLVGGQFGALIGIWIFTILKAMGLIDVSISLIYVLFLGSVGTLMAVESIKTLHVSKKPKPDNGKRSFGEKIRGLKLPFKTYFPRSNLTISAFLPIIIGVLAGMMVSLMGIGGGFVMIPAMIYILGIPATIVVGTSLFQIIFTTSMVTFLHAVETQSVDIILSILLIIGGVIGAQIGTAIGGKIPAEKLRFLLAAIVLAVCTKLAMGLFTEPENLYSIIEAVK